MQRKLLFASHHSLIDPSSGAAISALDLLAALPSRGWEVRFVSGPLTDFDRSRNIRQLLADVGTNFRSQTCQVNKRQVFDVLGYNIRGVPGLSFLPEKVTLNPSDELVGTFLKICRDVIDDWKPNVFLTYGGQSFLPQLLRVVKRYDAKTFFLLMNFAYRDAEIFHGFDAVIVPSLFCAHEYQKRLGIITKAIPSLIDPKNVISTLPQLSQSERRYVTFINPQPHKGVFVFAQIARVLNEIRPDIPLLVVEGRSGVGILGKAGVDLSGAKNVSMMPNTPYPADYYGVSRLVLMPSLCEETFGRVAAEAMMNGVPVLGSDRGALPETLGEAGFAIPVPQKYTLQTRVAPSAQEIQPWIDTILRLWDNAAFYSDAVERSRNHAEQWRYETLLDHYDRFLRSGLLNTV